MDLNEAIQERAMALLGKLVDVERWAESGDPRAKPYLDAGAVCLVNGKAQFSRQQFITVYADELMAQHKTV